MRPFSLRFAVALLCCGIVAFAGCAGGSVQNGGTSGETDTGRDVDTGIDAADTRPRDTTTDEDVSDGGADLDASDVDETVLDGTDGGEVDGDAGPCGGCGDGEVCREGRCVLVCSEAMAECGSIDAGGRTFDCGSCRTGSFCLNLRCRPICDRAGADCGEVFWGGRTTNCGACGSGKDCVQNRCASSGYRSISGGSRHTCATDDSGDVACWGRDAEEQLGNGSDGASTTPVDLAIAGRGVAARAGHQHGCAMLASGGARCWGLNNKGQVGNGSSDLVVASPASVDQLSRAVDLAAGRLHSCAVLETGRVVCWGAEIFGRLGNGKSEARTRRTPVQVKNLTNAVEVVAGSSHTCAIDANGGVWCWGNGSQGRLGHGRFSGSSTPVRVEEIDHAVDLAAGVDHTCAATRSGTAWCWGAGASYQLGNAQTGNRAVPVRVGNLASDAVEVAAGEKHSCAHTAQDEVYCWGANGSGQLGDGSFTRSTKPTQVVAPGGGSVIADVMYVAAGAEHTCAVAADGEAYCWGNNDAGQLGDGGTSRQNTPSRVP